MFKSGVSFDMLCQEFGADYEQWIAAARREILGAAVQRDSRH